MLSIAHIFPCVPSEEPNHKAWSRQKHLLK